MNQLPLFTVEDEHELLQLLAHLARQSSQAMAKETPGDVRDEGAAPNDYGDEVEDRSGYWLKDWQDIYAEEVCQKRFGEL